MAVYFGGNGCYWFPHTVSRNSLATYVGCFMALGGGNSRLPFANKSWPLRGWEWYIYEVRWETWMTNKEGRDRRTLTQENSLGFCYESILGLHPGRVKIGKLNLYLVLNDLRLPT